MPFNFITDPSIGGTCRLTLTEAIMVGLIPGTGSGVPVGYTATSATGPTPIRATVYTAPGAAAQRSIKSASANDAAAGTGAQTVRITYYDASMNGPFTEVVTLNGLTGVNTVGTNIANIERMDVVKVGSGGANAGVISLMTQTGGNGTAIGSINTNDNRTFWAHHHVPPGFTTFITNITSSCSAGGAGAVTLNVLNPIDSTVPSVIPTGILRHGTTAAALTFSVPVGIPGPALVFLIERPDSATAQTNFASFGYIDLS